MSQRKLFKRSPRPISCILHFFKRPNEQQDNFEMLDKSSAQIQAERLHKLFNERQNISKEAPFHWKPHPR